MRTTNEFVIEWILGDDRATATVPEGTKLNTELVKLAGKYPNDVEIVNPELFHVPAKWVHVRAPRQVSDEQKERARELMKKMRNKDKNQE